MACFREMRAVVAAKAAGLQAAEIGIDDRARRKAWLLPVFRSLCKIHKAPRVTGEEAGLEFSPLG